MVNRKASALIPRQTLFGNPDHRNVRLSHDGAYLSWVAPVNGVLNVWVAPRQTPTKGRPVTRDTVRGVRGYVWSYTPGLLIYFQDLAGDENWHLHVVNLETGDDRDLTPFEHTIAVIESISRQFPGQIVVGLNDRHAEWHDLYRLDLVTGERTLLLKNDRFAGFDVDDDYQLRFARQTLPDGSLQLYRPDGDGWQLWDTIGPDDVANTSLAGFGPDNRLVYLADSRGRDTSALIEVDPETKAARVLAEDPKCDFADGLWHPTAKRYQAAAFVYERKKWVILDAEVEPHLTYLQTLADGELEVISRTEDDRYWIVIFLIDDGPQKYYLYDRERQKGRFLFTNNDALAKVPLVKMQSAVIPARDGLELVVYYSRPLGATRPGPMVLIPHGGPQWRDSWGFDPLHQWLANRGYSVLSVNFRSSTGFGKTFLNAGNAEWGGKVLADQLDAVAWAIDHGIADRDKIAVLGASFGGYSVLAGLAFTPEAFACGVDLVGPSNLITLLETVPPYWKPAFDLLVRHVGDPRTEEGRALLTRHSPLTKAADIRRPLLIGQGANDPRVKRAESDQIVEALKNKGIPVTYLLYPDEGHGFARPENNLSFFAVAEEFLATSLGGRVEPIGHDFQGSSIQVVYGAEYVPGLQAALEPTS